MRAKQRVLTLIYIQVNSGSCAPATRLIQYEDQVFARYVLR